MPRDNCFACIWTKYCIWGKEILSKCERLCETWETRGLLESDSNQLSRNVIKRAAEHKLYLGRKHNGEKHFPFPGTVQRRGGLYRSYELTTFRDMERICWRRGLPFLEAASCVFFRDFVRSCWGWFLQSRLHIGEGIWQRCIDGWSHKPQFASVRDF